MDPATELLGKALEVLERDGWYQGNYCAGSPREDDSGKPVCALGALNRATFGNAWGARAGEACHSSEARERAHNRLFAAIGGAIPTWNDDPGRTYEDVVLTFKKAMAGE
ncbi:DUF6197 family protein [Streptomyces microflavus]|uniref:DUF6197 family protein n=1 Tax=Streptomyces microflavus TaxID=1919 RepID=UPI00368C3B17